MSTVDTGVAGTGVVGTGVVGTGVVGTGVVGTGVVGTGEGTVHDGSGSGASGVGTRPMSRATKAIIDRVGALLGLVLLAPVLLVVALVVLVTDGRPVLFRQVRTGRDGHLFTILKFRTLVADAESVARRLGIEEAEAGLGSSDPRITRPGHFLRRSGLDELPQLVNVLRGQMSLVGPRPDLPEQVARYDAAARRRLAVRPGLTGWAQVVGRVDIPWSERFALDRWYVEHWSLRLDLRIVLLTVRRVVGDVRSARRVAGDARAGA